jgi:hypothetical protein
VITNGSILTFYPVAASQFEMNSCMLMVVYFSILQRKLGIMLPHAITQGTFFTYLLTGDKITGCLL